MKYFAQFLTLSSGQTFKDGKIVTVEKFPIDALGSDGVFILDGRNNIETMVFDSKIRMHTLKNIHNYIGFKIMKGERFTDAKEIYKSI